MIPRADNSLAPGFWAEQLDDDTGQVAWLWDGYLARGNVTLLTSQWKSGKTTLLANLLARLKDGGTLAGLPVPKGRAAVVSEEPRLPWRLRHQKFKFRNVHFWLQPFRGKPLFLDWLALLEAILDVHARHPFDLAVFDTLTTLLPGRNEAQAGVLMEALLPLRQLTAAGLAVLLLHHPPKGESLPGQAARGSGALPSFADILLEMNFHNRADQTDRRRRLLAFSRFEQTPPQQVLELNADGTDYLVHGDFHQDEFTDNWKVLRLVLEDADDKKTRQEMLSNWPPDFPRPSETTLYRWLKRAVNLGLIQQEGDGRSATPFRYWLPEREKAWQQDPMWVFNKKMEDARRETLRRLGMER